MKDSPAPAVGPVTPNSSPAPTRTLPASWNRRRRRSSSRSSSPVARVARTGRWWRAGPARPRPGVVRARSSRRRCTVASVSPAIARGSGPRLRKAQIEASPRAPTTKMTMRSPGPDAAARPGDGRQLHHPAQPVLHARLQLWAGWWTGRRSGCAGLRARSWPPPWAARTLVGEALGARGQALHACPCSFQSTFAAPIPGQASRRRL